MLLIYQKKNLFYNMNTEHRYTLEKGSKKHACPDCAKKCFVRYIDTETSDYLPEQYGRCDRESKCSYHLNPYKDGYTKMIQGQEQGKQTGWKPQRLKRKKKPKQKMAFIPVEVFNHTCAGYEKNVFIQNLLTRVAFPFQVQDVEKVISLYHLGTIQNGYRTGANTFPFIDIDNNVRAVQVKQFNEANHTISTDFLHSIIKKHHTRKNKALPEWLEAYDKNETKVSCLFGEHLLNKYPYRPVALVEAPKTAVYSVLYYGFPEQIGSLLWLAVYNLSSLNLNKCKALKGRNVYLFPDLSKDGKAFELWSNKAKQIQMHLQGTYFQVSDLLEQLAPEQDKEQGRDIADYLIKQDWQQFRTQKTSDPVEIFKKEKNKKEVKIEISEPQQVNVLKGVKGVESASPLNNIICTTNQIESLEFSGICQPEPKNWSKDIAELESYFASIELRTQTVKLNKGSTITNVRLFIESHFAVVKANNGKRTFIPYLNRLQDLKRIIKIQ